MLEEKFPSSEPLKPPALVKATTDFIVKDWGITQDARRVVDNMMSIRTVTQRGKHDNVFYSCSGKDTVRALVAFDATHITTADTDPSVVAYTEQALAQIGLSPKVALSPDGQVKEITVIIDGKERKITEHYKDARIVAATLAPQAVDVLVYENYFTPLEEDLVGYPNVKKDDVIDFNDLVKGREVIGLGLQDTLTTRNYHMVSPGGFLTFNESALDPAHYPKAVLGLLGIVEVPIIARHPETMIATSSRKGSKSQERNGCIYQKLIAVPNAQVTLGMEALEAIRQLYKASVSRNDNEKRIDLHKVEIKLDELIKQSKYVVSDKISQQVFEEEMNKTKANIDHLQRI